MDVNIQNPRLASQEEWATAYFELYGALCDLYVMIEESEELVDDTGSAGVLSVLKNWASKHGHLLDT